MKKKVKSKNVDLNDIKQITEPDSQFKRVKKFLDYWYDFQYNEVNGEIECSEKGKNLFNSLNENNLFCKLRDHNLNISINNLIAILRSDFVKTVNPFLDYFNRLTEWKQGDFNHIDSLINHVKAIDQEQLNYHFKKALVRCVACALSEKFVNKQALIFVGGTQNTGKSTFIRFLCPPMLNKYISENLSFQDKDNLIGLSENFIINLDELAALPKIEINTLKTYFSKDQIKVRRPYDRKATTSPRRASFFGSTNKTEFLSDETGSVRWLCFEIESIDWNYSKSINIDMVWAQAFALFKNGFEVQLTSSDIMSNEERNNKHQHITIERELVQSLYQPGIKDFDLFLTATEITREIANKAPARLQVNIYAVSKALQVLGYTKHSKRPTAKENPIYGYYVKVI